MLLPITINEKIEFTYNNTPRKGEVVKVAKNASGQDYITLLDAEGKHKSFTVKEMQGLVKAAPFGWDHV